MIRWPVVLTLVYLAAVIETSLNDLLDVATAAPDWLALVAVAMVLALSDRYAFVAAAGIGLVSDLLAPGPLGPGMASFAIVSFAAGRWKTKFRYEHAAHHVAVTWVAVTLTSLAMASVAWLAGGTNAAPSTLMLRALGVGVYTAGVAVPVFMLLGWTGVPHWKHSA